MFDLIFLMGAVQGVFLAGVLAFRPNTSTANKILALLMLVFSVDLMMAVYFSRNYHQPFPHLIGIDYPLPLVYGPLFLAYIVTLKKGFRAVRGWFLLHFVPFLLLVTYLIPLFSMSTDQKLAVVEGQILGWYTQSLAVINHGKIFHGLLYVGLAIWYIRKFRREMKNNFSYKLKLQDQWIKNITIGMITLALFTFLLYGLSASTKIVVTGLIESHIFDDLTLMGVTILVYAIGYMGLRHPFVFGDPAILERISEEEIESMNRNDGNTNGTTEKYSKSGLNADRADEIREQLRQVMENEQLYQNSELTLSDLAEHLAVSTHNLTEVINTYMDQNFYDFVNSYRVQEVKRRLTESESQNLTLLAIGLDAGFNSKSSFNAVFKKQAGCTPSQYRKQQVGNGER